MEHPIKMDDLGVLYFRKPPYSCIKQPKLKNVETVGKTLHYLGMYLGRNEQSPSIPKLR